MKAILIILIIIVSSGCYVRLGELNMVSTRNIDSSANYQLIEKYVVGKARSKNGNALQAAIDDAVKSVPEGEYLQNVKVFIRQNGQIVKIEGDVWGIPSVNKQVVKSVQQNIEFKTGDRITYKNSFGKLVEGKIIGLNQNTAIVEFTNAFGKKAKTEVKYEELTKID
jgi:hypothetical protein